ncbi:hypothetical protein E6H34_05570 [Candidatus Bathyarchaeota archaeon]|nr:MAG: hypothetical protein E6H34_05570 [Candidatus Bathyarchaeota archaeon]
MSSALRTKEFLEFQQTLKDLENQLRKLLKEASANGLSETTRNMTGRVYNLAERANQIQPPETRNQSTTNQSVLEKLPEQFEEDFGKFKGLVTFVERVRKQHYNATGHNFGRTYGSFGTDELSPGRHHGKSFISTLEIRCDACGSESPQSERRDYPIHVLLHDRGQWEVCTGQSDCECQSYEGKGVRISVNLSPEKTGKGKA